MQFNVGMWLICFSTKNAVDMFWMFGLEYGVGKCKYIVT